MPVILTRKSVDASTLRLAYRHTTGKAKFTVTVPKKAFLLATDRNKVKRLIYSYIEHEYKLIKPGFFGIFTVKKGFLPKNKQDIKDLLKKANAYL